ncbi:MAG: hypothetical protein ACYC6K_09505 [Bellilinea sp.]
MKSKIPIDPPPYDGILRPVRRLPDCRPRQTELEQDLDRLHDSIITIALPQSGPETLGDALVILSAVCDALLRLTRVLRTHEALKSDGEPVAAQLEKALQAISRDLYRLDLPAGGGFRWMDAGQEKNAAD